MHYIFLVFPCIICLLGRRHVTKINFVVGYFVHIHSIEEVQQQVLKYINVIARPMILAKEEPPPTWTHANIDYTVIKYFVLTL